MLTQQALLISAHRSSERWVPMQEGQEYEAVPGSQFSVARTAHRSNQSDYYINDKKVSPKEVNERLKGSGIDLENNRFLILQVRHQLPPMHHARCPVGFPCWGLPSPTTEAPPLPCCASLNR